MTVNPVNANLHINEAGLEIIKNREQLYLRAYPCPSGVWSIGWGHTGGVGRFDTCTVEQAAEWLLNDVAGAEEIVRNRVKVPLTENQFAALVSFVFNIEQSLFTEADCTLLRLLNQGDYHAVPAQLARWVHGRDPKTGRKVRLPGLVIRRQMEAELWTS